MYNDNKYQHVCTSEISYLTYLKKTNNRQAKMERIIIDKYKLKIAKTIKGKQQTIKAVCPRNHCKQKS